MFQVKIELDQELDNYLRRSSPVYAFKRNRKKLGLTPEKQQQQQKNEIGGGEGYGDSNPPDESDIGNNFCEEGDFIQFSTGNPSIELLAGILHLYRESNAITPFPQTIPVKLILILIFDLYFL